MSSVHGNQGQPFGRPAAPSQNTAPNGQTAWPAQGQPAPQGYGYAPQPQGYAPQGQAVPAGYGQAAPAPYGQPAAPAGYEPQAAYPGYPNELYPAAPQANAAPNTAGRAPASYAPQFEPYNPAPVQQQPRAPHQAPAQPAQYAQHQGYVAPAASHVPTHAYTGQPAPHGYGAAPQPAAQPSAPAPQSWSQLQHPAHQASGASLGDPRGFDLGAYNPAPQGYGQEPALGHAQQAQPAPATEWPQDGYGHLPHEPAPAEYPAAHDYGQDPARADLGFGQASGGELDQGYVDDEAQDYETEAPSRFRRPLLMAAVLVGAIVLGGGSMYVYKALLGGPQAGDPPVVKSASQPTKVKPDDGGGKQFAHTDSKIMGRLGDGSSAAPDANGSDVDANGTRKVSTLVVGRDGSIQAPSPAPEAAAEPPVAPQHVNVPGLTVVDGLGAAPPRPTAPVQKAAEPAPVQVAAADPAPEQPRVVNAPAAPKKVTKVAPPPAVTEATGSIEPQADAEAAAPAAPVAKPKKVKQAAVTAPVNDAASTSVATTGSGFVAVLASVPRSNSSRMDALKRFADMQQKYASVLAGKTPDVAEANLGTKGAYHRLVVGPPGSREQASSVCSQLKSQGYNDCWVTSY